MSLSECFLEVAAWLHLCQIPGVLFLGRHVVNVRADLSKLPPLTHAIFVVIGASTVGLLVTLGVTIGSYAQEVVTSDLGLVLCLALGLFWFMRFVVQLWYYRSSLWPQHRSALIAHYTLLVVFALQAAGYLAAWTLSVAHPTLHAVART